MRDPSNGKFGFREFDVQREVTDRAEIIEMLREPDDARWRLSGAHNSRKLTIEEAEAIYAYCFDPEMPFQRKPRPDTLH